MILKLDILTRLTDDGMVAIGNEEDAEKVFGIHAKGADVGGGYVDARAASGLPAHWRTALA